MVRPNIEHHQKPFELTKSSYLERNLTTLVAAIPVAMIAAHFGCWSVVVGLLWLSQGNEIHSWAHQKCSKPVRVFQELGLLQSPRIHALHHQRPFDSNYCACTDYLNPILEAVDFWPRLERIIAIATGIRPRPERELA